MMQAHAESTWRLREMTSDDLPAAHALSKQLQWPHRREDWALFLRLGRGIVALADDRLVGTAMSWSYGGEAASIGMVIVSPDYQERGIGRGLMTAIMADLDDRTLLLNATDDGLPLYARMGFKGTDTIRQHQGAAFSLPIISLGPDERVRPMGAGDTAAVIELDFMATGLQHSALLSELVRNAKGLVLDRAGEAIGFSLLRRFGRGYVVGPTVAPHAEGAKAMISFWLGSNAGQFTRLDVPESSEINGWLDNLGIATAGRVATMVRGDLPARSPDLRVFSIAAQAFG